LPFASTFSKIEVAMAPSGMGERMEKPLECPRCASKVAWNGTEFVCPACTWTEFKEKPPSSRIIEIPKEIRDRREDKTE